jgi:hypothetical protein
MPEHEGLRKDGEPDQRVGTGGKLSQKSNSAAHPKTHHQSSPKARSTHMRLASRVAKLAVLVPAATVPAATIPAATNPVVAPRASSLTARLILTRLGSRADRSSYLQIDNGMKV